jgi:methionyl aminopeptidase
MRVNNGSQPFGNSQLIILQDDQYLANLRVAGKIASQSLIQLQGLCEAKSFHSLKALNDLTEDFIIKEGGFPTFKGYKGFPAGVCISVNNQLVHGIPTDYKLQEGDLVSFDLGVSVAGSIADTAITIIFGRAKSQQHLQLINATEEALFRAIQSIKIGRKLGCIGYAINKVAKQHNYSVIEQYGGHGISMSADKVGIPHSSPFIANVDQLNNGIRAEIGNVLAIEPLFVLGSSNKTKVLSDNWTVECDNLCSHYEHTIYLHSDHIEIISYRGNEKYLKSNKIYY